MKEKFLVVACAVSVLASAAALAASVAVRARAAEPAETAVTAVTDSGLKVVAENNETRIYSFRSEGHLCFAASTRGGSGISLQCPH